MTLEKQPITPDPELSGRRTAVKRILGGAGMVAGSQALPDGWTRPVISTAAIPAHAAASEFCSDVEFSANAIQEQTAITELELSFAVQDPEYEGSFEVEFQSENPGGISGGGDASGTIEDGFAELNEFEIDFAESFNGEAELEANIFIDGSDGESGDAGFNCVVNTDVTTTN